MQAKDGSFGFDFAGTYTKIVQHERIEYAFGERQGWQSNLNNFTRLVEQH
jgi:uncharacterized protein YndB with AHSA1/START domain